MKSSVPVARATATLPRNWSRRSLTSGLYPLALAQARPGRRQESSGDPGLILKRFFAADATPPTIEVGADEDDLAVVVASTRSDHGSPPRPRSATTVARPPPPPSSTAPIGRLAPAARRAPSSPARSPQRRQQLIRKQSRRQSIPPSFFEPATPARPPEAAQDRPPRRPPKLTVSALSAHDDPAGTCLSAPISSLFPSIDHDDDHDDEGDGDGEGAGDARARILRRCASFNVAPSASLGPGINVVKALPECLDDHSNPSSRDPFFYAAFEGRLPTAGNTSGSASGGARAKARGAGGVKKQASTDWSVGSAGGSLGSGCVTAWVVQGY